MDHTLKSHPQQKILPILTQAVLHRKSQRAKLRGILQYFDYLDAGGERALDGRLLLSRQVMLARQWLTIEDWLESSAGLCPLSIRHEGRLERTELEPKPAAQVCFASRSLGDAVLGSGCTQETIQVSKYVASFLSRLRAQHRFRASGVAPEDDCRAAGGSALRDAAGRAEGDAERVVG